MNSKLINNTIQFVKQELKNAEGGHDWFHIERVYKMAVHLQAKEGGDREIIELAALLHDISDHKMNGGVLNAGGNVAFDLLIDLGCDELKALKVKEIVDGVSYTSSDIQIRRQYRKRIKIH